MLCHLGDLLVGDRLGRVAEVLPDGQTGLLCFIELV